MGLAQRLRRLRDKAEVGGSASGVGSAAHPYSDDHPDLKRLRDEIVRLKEVEKTEAEKKDAAHLASKTDPSKAQIQQPIRRNARSGSAQSCSRHASASMRSRRR